MTTPIGEKNIKHIRVVNTTWSCLRMDQRVKSILCNGLLVSEVEKG